MAIYTAMGEPVEIVGRRMINLLDPTTAGDPIVKVRSKLDPSWVRDCRVSRLKADGDLPEIEAAIKEVEAKR